MSSIPSAIADAQRVRRINRAEERRQQRARDTEAARRRARRLNGPVTRCKASECRHLKPYSADFEFAPDGL